MSLGHLSLGALVLWASAVSTQDDPAGPASVKPADLAGVYSLVSGEKYGQGLPQEEIADTSVRITADRIVVLDRDEKEVYVASYQLHPGRTPWRITMATKSPDGEEATAEGLIETEGGLVRLIYALPGAETPTAFKTADKQLMFVLKKRAAPEPAKPAG